MVATMDLANLISAFPVCASGLLGAALGSLSMYALVKVVLILLLGWMFMNLIMTKNGMFARHEHHTSDEDDEDEEEESGISLKLTKTLSSSGSDSSSDKTSSSGSE